MGHAVPRMARALAFLVLSFVIGHVSVARAEGASPREGDTVTVVVEDEPSCTSNDDFFRRIEARAAGLRRATSGAPARTFIARLSATANGGVLGRLRTRELDGTESVRELTGSSCAEVAEALALIAAVTVRGDDPVRDLGSHAMPTPDAEEPNRPAPPPSPLPETETAFKWRLSCGGTASIHTSVMPAALYGLGAVCDVAREATAWRPSLGLAAERTLTAHAPTDDAISQSEMAADLTLGRLFISPFSVRAGKLDLRPAATFEIGWLEASGRGTGLARAGQDAGLWMAAGALGQAVLRVSGNWGVTLGLGGQVPLTRYTFSYRENSEAYRMRAVGVLGTVSIWIGLL